MDKNKLEFKNYRTAVENHWDPSDIDIGKDISGALKLADEDFYEGIGFDVLRKGLAMFGAGEKDVTEDLSPLAVVTQDIESQMFITTQLYDEAKHAEFFENYWEEVINVVEERKGMRTSNPTDDRFFSSNYETLFKKNEEAMKKLLDSNTKENRIKAYSHYHLVIEGILAQTGYWVFQETLSEENKDTPDMPGLIEGFTKIRGDESRHVGFGVEKLKEEIDSMEHVNKVCKDLLPDIQNIFLYVWEDIQDHENYPAPTLEDTLDYLKKEHSARLEKLENNI